MNAADLSLCSGLQILFKSCQMALVHARVQGHADGVWPEPYNGNRTIMLPLLSANHVGFMCTALTSGHVCAGNVQGQEEIGGQGAETD